MSCYNIMTIIVNQRSEEAPEVQKILTKYGCIIKIRLGLHEAGGVTCENEGLIILQLTGDGEEIKNLEEDLNDIKGIVAKNMQICSK